MAAQNKIIWYAKTQSARCKTFIETKQLGTARLGVIVFHSPWPIRVMASYWEYNMMTESHLTWNIAAGVQF